MWSRHSSGNWRAALRDLYRAIRAASERARCDVSAASESARAGAATSVRQADARSVFEGAAPLAVSLPQESARRLLSVTTSLPAVCVRLVRYRVPNGQ